MHGNFQENDIKFLETKQLRAAPVPLNPMVTKAYNDLQQHPTRQMIDHNSSTSANMDEYV
jgi:hypothetical protein